MLKVNAGTLQVVPAKSFASNNGVLQVKIGTLFFVPVKEKSVLGLATGPRFGTINNAAVSVRGC